MTPAEICNIGAALLGEGRITSTFTTAPANKRERLCYEHYNRIRLSMLRENIWNFAKKRGICQQAAVAPEFGYTHAYFFPADFHRLISIGDTVVWYSRSRVNYSIEQHPLVVNGVFLGTQRALLIDASLLAQDAFAEQAESETVKALRIVYVSDIKDAAQFDIHFANALGARLFKEIGPSLTEENNRIARCESAENQAMADALQADAMETPPIQFEEDDWLEVRIGSF